MRGKSFYRTPVTQYLQQKMSIKTLPAPIRGLVLNENLAATQGASACVLENFFPTTSGIRVRGGAKKKAKIANNSPCAALFNYVNGATEKFFAATQNAIYDITNVVDANVIPAPVVSGLTSGKISTVQFENAGGKFLYVVNGANSARLYDGTNWTIPSITGVSSADLSYVWAYGSRLWFIEKNTLNVWYLSVDAIAGAATKLSLSGIFQNGGSLVFGATWSPDAGDGLGNKIVFCTDRGEVAIYSGVDPSSAAAWSRDGVYSITAPLGYKAIMRAGSDLLIATKAGLISISQAVNRDVAALEVAAVSRPIQPLWQKNAGKLLKPWEIVKWSSKNMMIISQPKNVSSDAATCLVTNLDTGAWGFYKGWDTNCLGFYNDYAYFGTTTGEIFQMEVGGNDDGMAYTCTYVGAFDHVGSISSQKTVRQARAIFTASSPRKDKLTVSTNYVVKLPSAPNSVENYTLDIWDSGVWDQAQWDAPTPDIKTGGSWVSIGKTGYTFAPQLQMTFAVTPTPDVNLVSIDLTFESGGVVC